MNFHSSGGMGYTQYIAQYTGLEPATDEITIAAADYSAAEGFSPEILKSYKDRPNAVKWTGETGSLTYEFTVPQSGLYTIGLSYCPLPGRGNPLRLGIKLDGYYLFDSMKELEFPVLWENAGRVRTDGQGNEFAPEQVQIFEFIRREAMDMTGQQAAPFVFALDAGKHTIQLISLSEEFVLDKIILGVPEIPESYKVVSEQYKEQGYTGYTGPDIVIQGEDAETKSTRSLIPMSDNSDPSVYPSDAFKSRINYIGSSNWKSPGETLTWKFTVETSGLYKLGFRYRQNAVMNGSSYRWLKIDGKTPFEEASRIPFSYHPGWRFMEFGDENQEPYLVYLTAGEHELSMSVTLGELADLSRKLEELIYSIGDFYLKMAMIIGETPDVNRDYDLFRQIPDYTETLTKNMEGLHALAQEMEAITNKKGGRYAAAMRSMAMVLKSMLDNPYSAQEYKKSYYDNYTNICSWLYEMRSMPLDIDEIRFGAPGKEFDNRLKNVFSKIWFSICRFIASFTEDYDNVSSTRKDMDEITVWVWWGRDQAQILNSLIQDSFVPKYNANVKVEIVNASLIQGMLSGNVPDCMLQVSRTEPVNLGMRGALYDLKSFKDFNEVIAQFMPNATLPYELGDKCYAIPDTQNFYMLFYRTDIFEKLELTPPRTWDEFLEVSATLQRNNLQVYLPYSQITDMYMINAGMGSLNLFPTLLKQRKLSLYSEDKSRTTLDQPETVAVFSFWTDFYTKLKYPVVSDFYNRFRIGLMPMGIQLYSMYSLLSVAAPEITNRWAMAPIPGTVLSDGTVNNAVVGGGTGAVIPQMSKKKELAWEFIKWWVSPDTQYRYSNDLESILGVAGRHPTSNVEAFSRLSWKSEDLKQLMAQWEKVDELEEIPGGYYTPRAIDQAYWNTVNMNMNPKDQLLKWNQIVNEEITRKRNQYGIR